MKPLEFEKPLDDLYTKIDELKQLSQSYRTTYAGA